MPSFKAGWMHFLSVYFISIHVCIHNGMDTLSECLFYLRTNAYPQLNRYTFWMSVFSWYIPALLIPDTCLADTKYDLQTEM